jgi:GNAT superfamily N-acetyltransferase
MGPRAASLSDLDRVVESLALAFRDDPLWSWAFPGGVGMEEWWRVFVTSALHHSEVWMVGEAHAVAVLIPPGGSELTEREEALLEPLLEELVGPRTPEVMELVERFDASHPADPPHYYLSLLGTHPDHRGQGLGMGLLAACLERMDGEGAPAYLESSNPDNDRRYTRLGFEAVGGFTTPDQSRAVTTMWREPR